MSIAREMIAAGPGCAVANGLLNGFETTKVKLQLHVCLDKGTTLLLQCKKNGITLSDILLEFLKVRIPYLKVLRRGLSTPEPPSIHPPLRWKFAVSSLSQVTKIRPDSSLFPFCNCSKGREPCTPFFFS